MAYGLWLLNPPPHSRHVRPVRLPKLPCQVPLLPLDDAVVGDEEYWNQEHQRPDGAHGEGDAEVEADECHVERIAGEPVGPVAHDGQRRLAGIHISSGPPEGPLSPTPPRTPS